MLYTVEPLISHTPRWIARAMGYERLWVLRGQFGCKFQFGSGQNLWGMGGYGFRYESFDCIHIFADQTFTGACSAKHACCRQRAFRLQEANQCGALAEYGNVSIEKGLAGCE